MQLDQAERGFSFRFEGPLDMRMERAGQSAADLVNEMAERPLADLIFTFGEEKKARRIAKAIVAARALAPISTTQRSGRDRAPRHRRRRKDRIDPATRTFQALRIAVNDELGEIDRGLAAAERLLAPGGRMAVVSFHSLEDRRVKQFLRDRAGRNPKASRHLPIQDIETQADPAPDRARRHRAERSRDRGQSPRPFRAPARGRAHRGAAGGRGMIRISAIVWVVVLALLGIGLFQVKYNVQSKERDLREVRRQIEANYNAIHVLDAEWSYLNDPLRLADLTRRHTELVPTTPGQIGDFASLPLRIEDLPLTPEVPAEPQPPLVSSAPQAQPAAPVVQVKAADQEQQQAQAPQAKQEPKPLKPKDEQAEADAMIDAILADMEKAQDQPSDDGGAQ